MARVPSPRPHAHDDENDHHDDRPDLVHGSSQCGRRAANSTGRGTPVTSGFAMRGETAPCARCRRSRRATASDDSDPHRCRQGPLRRGGRWRWTAVSVVSPSSSYLPEAVDQMRVDAVRIEPARHQVAGAHPAPAGPLPERDPRPGAPAAAGSIFTRSSASFTPRGLSGWASAKARSSAVAMSRFTTGTQYCGRRRRPLRTGRGSAGRRGCPRRTGRCRSIPGTPSTSPG